MIKKNLKTMVITSFIILLPIIFGLVYWNELPEKMPNHWNMQGEVDGWSSKAMAVFGMPLFLVLIQWICALGLNADPKKQNHSDKVLKLVFWIIPVLSVCIHAAVYGVAMGKNIRIEFILSLVIGVVFVLIGNYLPKCKQNYTIGIKIPWTLNSEENWNKTHRMAGYLWVVCGVANILFCLFGLIWAILPVIFVMVVVPVIYSYMLHRKGE